MEFLQWDNSTTWFFLSDQLVTSGPINAGHNLNAAAPTNYNSIASSAPSPDSPTISDSGDLYVGGDVEIDGALHLDGALHISDKYLQDQFIYFYDDGSPQGQSLKFHSFGAPGQIVDINYFEFSARVNAPSFANTSDRNAKTEFEPVNPDTVLEKLAAIPVTEWRYKHDDRSSRHIGPMAQDFHAAFGLGASDTTISTVDTAGVAFAAIQALKAENDALKLQNQAILDRLEQLEENFAQD